MSYDLDFWQYENELPAADHQAVYERLSNGESIAGLRNIPVADILARLNSVFSSQGWTQLDATTWEGKTGAFQIFTTPQFFRVDCHGMDGEDMNRLIDLAAEFNLPLYDPQVGKRYGS